MEAAPTANRPLDHAAKAALLQRFGSQMHATARRWSASTHDADDAYQRASEILLTHEPSGSDDDLRRWLRTTVKHEAMAIRRHQDRCVPAGRPDHIPVDGPNPADTETVAERYERLRLGARALRTLKPQERSCVVLQAQGFSYPEIAARTGFSATKVNRCLTEGRRAMRRLLASAAA